MGLLSSISSAIFDRGIDRSSPPSYFGSQTTYLAGPLYLDAFNAKRSPTPFELVEQYKSLIYACVQLNAFGVARVALRLYTDSQGGRKPRDISGPLGIKRSMLAHLQRSGYLTRSAVSKEDIQEITNHPLIDMLDHPDSEGYFSREDVLGLIAAYCDVVGVAYCKLDPTPSKGVPSFMWPLQAQYVYDVKKSASPILDYYRYFLDIFKPEQLLRFRIQLSLRDPYGRGYSPTYAALQYAMLEDKYIAIQDQLLGMGPRPNLLVSAKDANMPFGEAERERYRQDLNRQHSRGMAGGVLVTNGAVDVKPLSYSPTDLGGLTIAEYDLERTCNCFGIPPSYFSKDTNLANLQASEAQHARTAIEPRCKAIAGTLTRLAKRYDERLFFAFDPCVESDAVADAKVTQIHLQTGLTTINEELTDMPFEDKPWGDSPWLPGTLKQPEMIEEAHKQGIESAKAGVEKTQTDTENSKVATQFQYTDPPAEDDESGQEEPTQEERSLPEDDYEDRRLEEIMESLERALDL